MHLTQTAEYALRAMTWLARQPTGAALRSQALAEATGIPQHYVSKLLRKLVVAGLLESQKGHGGGFALARPPAEVRFIDILRAVDYEPAPDRCAFGWGACNPLDPCPLHGPWSRLSEAFFAWADRTTLADVQADAPPLPDDLFGS